MRMILSWRSCGRVLTDIRRVHLPVDLEEERLKRRLSDCKVSD